MDRNELTRVHYRPYCTYETRLIDHVMSTKLLNDRLRVAEVGARGGSDDQWRALGANIEIVGFEPDADECLRLNAERTRHNDGRGMPLSRYVPTALWRDIGSQEFYVTYDPCCSSVLAYPVNAHDRYM